MKDVMTMFAEFDKTLLGIPDDKTVSHTVIFQNLLANPDIVTILFERDNNNVRALKVSGNTLHILGIPKSEIDGHLLTDFVNKPVSEVAKEIDIIERCGLLVKQMSLGGGYVVDCVIFKERKGRYFEVIWKA